MLHLQYKCASLKWTKLRKNDMQQRLCLQACLSPTFVWQLSLSLFALSAELLLKESSTSSSSFPSSSALPPSCGGYDVIMSFYPHSHNTKAFPNEYVPIHPHLAICMYSMHYYYGEPIMGVGRRSDFPPFHKTCVRLPSFACAICVCTEHLPPRTHCAYVASLHHASVLLSGVTTTTRVMLESQRRNITWRRVSLRRGVPSPPVVVCTVL